MSEGQLGSPRARDASSRSHRIGWRARGRRRSSRAARSWSHARCRGGRRRTMAPRRAFGGACTTCPTASGARAVGVRREPVPAAYRVFFRHIGLDPEVRTNADRGGGARADAARRLYARGDLLEDVLLIALVDTGVPVWALDARRPSTAARRAGRAARASRWAQAADAPSLPGGQAGGGGRLRGAGRAVRRARAGSCGAHDAAS